MVLRLITFRAVVGVGALTLLNATQTLLVDMMPNQGSSITACVRPRLSTILWIPLILVEQPRSLLAGCWHGIDYKPYPRRTR